MRLSLYLYCLFTVFLFFSCQTKKKEALSIHTPRPVKVVKVEALGSIDKQYSGIVEADQFSILAFKVPGTLTKFPVREGQTVRKGELIAQINSFDYQKQLQTAQANYKTAQSIYNRTQRLYKDKAVSLQNLEIADADFVRASSALNIAERTLNYTTLTAPFKGFIEKIYVKNYEEVLTGQSIVKLVNPDNIEINFILPENGTALLHLPKKVFVEFDTRKGQLFTTEIKEYIYSSQGSGIPVTLNITDKQFAPYRKYVFPGFSCKVTIEIDNMISDNFVIPESALLQAENAEYVWIIRPGTLTAHRQKVITRKLNGQILVQDGLNSEDIIVTAGVSSIREGQKVSLIKDQKY